MRTSSPTAAGLAALLSLALSTGAAGSVAEPAPTCDGKPATIVVPPEQSQTVWTVGTPGDDVIVGSDGSDLIDGAGGDDTICGLEDADEIIGGPGNDRLFGGDDYYFADDDYWGDIIQPGAGDDYVDLGAQIGPDDMYWVDAVYGQKVSYVDAPGPVNVDLTTLTATGHGTDTFAPTPADKYTGIIGSPYDDVLTGGPAHDQIHGGGGNDVLTGGPGDDDLDGDASSGRGHGSTTVPGDDVVIGGPGDDTVAGGPGTDVVRGNQGSDYVVGQPGAVKTVLLGGADDDRLVVTPGSRARGGSGDDEFQMALERPEPGDALASIAGGGGRDQVEFQSFGGRRVDYDLKIDVPKKVIRHHGTRHALLRNVEEFVIHGRQAPGRVTFRGGRKSELFRVKRSEGFTVRAFGRGGNDVLVGGNRNDFLHGGRGRDRLVGRDGRDRCVAGERLRSCEHHG